MDFTKIFEGKFSDSPGFLFIRVYNKWHSEIKKQLQTLGITLPQFVVMATLAYLSQEEKNVTQVMISKFSDMDVMTVSQVLKLLEQKGAISRMKHPNNTRANRIQLEAEGERLLSDSMPMVLAIDKHYFGSLGASEVSFMKNLVSLEAFDFKD